MRPNTSRCHPSCWGQTPPGSTPQIIWSFSNSVLGGWTLCFPGEWWLSGVTYHGLNEHRCGKSDFSWENSSINCPHFPHLIDSLPQGHTHTHTGRVPFTCNYSYRTWPIMTNLPWFACWYSIFFQPTDPNTVWEDTFPQKIIPQTRPKVWLDPYLIMKVNTT